MIRLIRNPGRATVTRRGVAAAAGLLMAMSVAACNDKPAASTPPPPAVVYPKLSALMTYTLDNPPSKWELTYANGRVQLRDGPQFQLGFRVDPANAAESQVVKNNKATGDKDGWKMTPVDVDGGHGYRAEYTATNGDKRLFWFFAKKAVSVTLSVNLGATGDPAMSTAAESLIASLKFADPVLESTVWPMPEPVLPFTYEMPKPLAGQKQSAVLRDYIYNLWWANQSVQVVTSLGEDAAATKKFYEDKKSSLTATGVTIRKFGDKASHDDEGLFQLSTKVDEGFALKVSSGGVPAIGAIIFYRKAFYCLISVRAVENQELDGLAAMTAPFDIGDTLQFGPALDP